MEFGSSSKTAKSQELLGASPCTTGQGSNLDLVSDLQPPWSPASFSGVQVPATFIPVITVSDTLDYLRQRHDYPMGSPNGWNSVYQFISHCFLWSPYIRYSTSLSYTLARHTCVPSCHCSLLCGFKWRNSLPL